MPPDSLDFVIFKSYRRVSRQPLRREGVVPDDLSDLVPLAK